MLKKCDALEIRNHAGVGVFPESRFSSLLVFCMTSNGQETAWESSQRVIPSNTEKETPKNRLPVILESRVGSTGGKLAVHKS